MWVSLDRSDDQSGFWSRIGVNLGPEHVAAIVTDMAPNILWRKEVRINWEKVRF